MTQQHIGVTTPNQSHRERVFKRVTCLVALGASSFTAGNAIASPGAPNILFFGSSFTQSYYPKDIPTLLRDIHVVAGKPTGTFFRRTSSGYSFQAHLQSTGVDSVEYLATQTLPAGEKWDYVVMQGNSIEPTATMGNPANFLASGKAIFDGIRSANPDAKAVMFETWARNPHFEGFYPTPFASPTAMQGELSSGYRELYDNVLDAYGTDSARYAGVGRAFAGTGFADAIYGNDFYHSNNRGEMMIALTLYGALHGPTATQLAQRGLLDQIAVSLYLTPADVMPMAIAADAAGAPKGDADLDWDVDFDDLLSVAQNYGKFSNEVRAVTWFDGDFDASGKVDFDDLLNVAQKYGYAYSGTANVGSSFESDWALARSIVPEPYVALAVCGVLAFASPIASRRRI